MNEQMEQVIKEAVSDADLTLSEIPRIDLYLDQILNLVSEKNEEGSSRYQERILTKTMINNYSKEGAILPIKGKKYNRQQVLQILFIYSLKNTLSIGEIKRIFEGTYALEGFGEAELEALWRDYLSMKEHAREETQSLCDTVTEQLSLDLEKDDDYLRLLLALVSLSAYLKTVAETMIDVRFPMPASEEEFSDKPKKATKSEKVAAKAEKVAEKAEKVAEKAEKVAAKAEKIAEKESVKAEKAEKKKAKKKEKASEKADEKMPKNTEEEMSAGTDE